jgi:hypothetical protein
VRLVESKGLACNEQSLTGEPESVPKDAQWLAPPLNPNHNSAAAGTAPVSRPLSAAASPQPASAAAAVAVVAGTNSTKSGAAIAASDFDSPRSSVRNGLVTHGSVAPVPAPASALSAAAPAATTTTTTTTSTTTSAAAAEPAVSGGIARKMHRAEPPTTELTASALAAHNNTNQLITAAAPQPQAQVAGAPLNNTALRSGRTRLKGLGPATDSNASSVSDGTTAAAAQGGMGEMRSDSERALLAAALSGALSGAGGGAAAGSAVSGGGAVPGAVPPVNAGLPPTAVRSGTASRKDNRKRAATAMLGSSTPPLPLSGVAAAGGGAVAVNIAPSAGKPPIKSALHKPSVVGSNISINTATGAGAGAGAEASPELKRPTPALAAALSHHHSHSSHIHGALNSPRATARSTALLTAAAPTGAARVLTRALSVKNEEALKPRNMVYMGCTVAEGRARGVVVKTGMNTYGCLFV